MEYKKIKVKLSDIMKFEVGSSVWVLERGKKPVEETIIDLREYTDGHTLYITNERRFHQESIGVTVFFSKRDAIDMYRTYRKIRRSKKWKNYWQDKILLCIALIIYAFIMLRSFF